MIELTGEQATKIDDARMYLDLVNNDANSSVFNFPSIKNGNDTNFEAHKNEVKFLENSTRYFKGEIETYSDSVPRYEQGEGIDYFTRFLFAKDKFECIGRPDPELLSDEGGKKLLDIIEVYIESAYNMMKVQEKYLNWEVQINSSSPSSSKVFS